MQEEVRLLNLQAFIIYQGEEEEIFCMIKQGMQLQQQASQAGWFFPFFFSIYFLFLDETSISLTNKEYSSSARTPGSKKPPEE